MRENDQLDLLIDAALATYSEPPAGLEDRVLQALAAEREASVVMPHRAPLRRRWLPWAIAVPIAACALLALFIQLREPHHESQAINHSSPLPQRSVSPPSMPATRDARTPLGRSPKVRTRQIAPEIQVAALPKLDVFPTPRPLTPEEQALSVYFDRAPKPELEALARAQAQDEKPFPIATAHIPPMSSPDDDKN